jgi:hypothetical protein
MKRYLVGLAAAGAALAGSLALATPASAAPPERGCPPGFFEFPTSQLPLDTSGKPSVDVNGDGITCVILIATNANGTGTRFAAVDNASNVP